MGDEKVTFGKRDKEQLLNQLTRDLNKANERIAELETNISEGNLLMQRFTDGDILYSRDEIPLTMRGLGRKLNAEQQRIATLTADLATARGALRPFAKRYDTQRHSVTIGNTEYFACGIVSDCKAAALLGDGDKGDGDETD